MPYNDKLHSQIWQKGYTTGCRVKGGKSTWIQLMSRYPRLRKEFEKEVAKRIKLKDKIRSKND